MDYARIMRKMDRETVKTFLSENWLQIAGHIKPDFNVGNYAGTFRLIYDFAKQNGLQHAAEVLEEEAQRTNVSLTP